MAGLLLPDDLLAALERIAAARRTTAEALAAEVLGAWAAQQPDGATAQPESEANDYAEFDNVDYILAQLRKAQEGQGS
ncbi:MAG TPA: hypothetical protein VEI97_12990 [bacterium]|nr:hypothetical protein [bacterium]